MRITIGSTTIDTTLDQDAGLLHAASEDNVGQGQRAPLTPEALLVRHVRTFLDRASADAEGARLAAREEEARALLRDPEKKAAFEQFLDDAKK